jgi:hypothetical protein
MFCLVGISYLANSSKSRHVLIAGFFFSLAAMTRSTGVLLSVFIAYKMLPKILYTPNCGKLDMCNHDAASYAGLLIY